MLAFGLLGCVMLVFLPLGCGGIDENARVSRPVSEAGLKLPENTLMRLQECADEYAPRLGSSEYKLDFAMEADTSGRVLQMTKTQMDPFNRDVGTCMKFALQAMTVPVSAIQAASGPLVSKNTQGPADRGKTGFVFVPVAVASVAEIMLVSGAVTFLFTIAVSLVKAVAEEIEDVIDTEKETKRYCKEQQTKCLETSTQSKPGSLKGSSLCLWCFEECLDTGSWPKEVRGTGKGWQSCN